MEWKKRSREKDEKEEEEQEGEEEEKRMRRTLRMPDADAMWMRKGSCVGEKGEGQEGRGEGGRGGGGEDGEDIGEEVRRRAGWRLVKGAREISRRVGCFSCG